MGHRTIKDLPLAERPRERLLKQGAQALTPKELLAIFLRTGLPGKSALELAGELLERFGGLRGLYQADDEELKCIKGLGTAKIAQLRAAIELSKRYIREELEQNHILDSPARVVEYLMASLRDKRTEEFHLLLLDSKHRLLEDVIASTGDVAHNTVYPREVIRLAIKYGAAAVIFVHNHPAGDPKPSTEDKKLTRSLVFACGAAEIRVLDHLIIGDNRYYSFAESGLIARYNQALARSLAGS